MFSKKHVGEIRLQVYYRQQEHKIAREYPIEYFSFRFVRYDKILVSYGPLHPTSVRREFVMQ